MRRVVLVLALISGIGLCCAAVDAQVRRRGAAKRAAARTFEWRAQGLTLGLPGGWRKSEEDKEWLRLQGPDNLQVTVSVGEWMGAPTAQAALEKQYEVRLSMQKEGALSGVRYLGLDGLRGVFWQDTTEARGTRFSHLNWHAYRERAGEVLRIMVALEGPPDAVARRRSELDEILNSIRFAGPPGTGSKR